MRTSIIALAFLCTIAAITPIQSSEPAIGTARSEVGLVAQRPLAPAVVSKPPCVCDPCLCTPCNGMCSVALAKVVTSTVASSPVDPFAGIPFAPLDPEAKAVSVAMFPPLPKHDPTHKAEAKDCPACDCACDETGVCACDGKVKFKKDAKATPQVEANEMPVPAGVVAPVSAPIRVIYFGYEACPHCRVMKANVLPYFSMPGYQLIVYDIAADSNAAGWASYYGLNGFPAFVKVGADDRMIARHVGGMNLAQFNEWVTTGR
jgi:hypothetical protein